MTITGQSSLAKDDIERMVRDAEAHAEDDRHRREEAEVRNTADTLVYQTEKLLKEQGEKFEGSEKDDVETALQGPQGRAGRDERGGHQGRHREAGRRVAELQPAPLRAGVGLGFGRRRRGATVAPVARRRRGGSDDDVVDAEIVDEQ